MTVQRWHWDAQIGQQLYAVLESCKTPQALWDKLASGNYDWLGVRLNGRFVVGRPSLSPNPNENGRPTPDPVRDRHRVEYLGPLDRVPRYDRHETAEEARGAYDRLVTGDPVTPLQTSGVWKVRLIVDGRSLEEVLVVRSLPRMV